MHITTDTYMAATNFVIYTFYGERTCFCWNADKLILFPYMQNNHMPAKVLTAPAPIKTIQCFTGRIFLICIPQGIYKLSKHQEFVVLSKSAIGMGSIFCEVLTPRNKYLYLDNKQRMTNKILFRLSLEECDSTKLCVCPLSINNIEEHFMRALINIDETVKNLCIIGDQLKLLTLANETVRIIYSSVYPIKDIVTVLKGLRVAGLLLLTDTDVIILIHSKDNSIASEQIYLTTQVQAIYAGFSQSCRDTLWIIYSDECRSYWVKKQLQVDNVQQTKVEDESFICFQIYDCNIILGLTKKMQLVELSVNTVENTLLVENDSFVNLHANMLKEASFIMDKIYKGTQELHSLHKTLTMEEDKLRKINLYAHKCKTHLPIKATVKRTNNQLYLSTNLCGILPKGCWIVANVKSDGRRVFCIKQIAGHETVFDMQIPESLTIKFSKVAIDIIVLKDIRYPWCLTRDFVIDDFSNHIERKEKTLYDSNFINSKIALLDTLIKAGDVNMKKISEIKKNIRNKLDYI